MLRTFPQLPMVTLSRYFALICRYITAKIDVNNSFNVGKLEDEEEDSCFAVNGED